MSLAQLRSYLDENGVKYVVIQHSEAFTAQEVAASAHIPGKEVAKSVVVRIDDRFAMAVLPASYHVDFRLLEQAVGASSLELAKEEDFEGLFPGCELGAMPPFGNLFDMDVYVAESLAEDEEIAFNACSHTELVRMKYADYARLANPKILRFSAVG